MIGFIELHDEEMIKPQALPYPLNLAKAVIGDDYDTVNIRGLTAVISRLTEQQQRVIQLRYANLNTLQGVAAEMGVTRERVRQIEAKVLRWLRSKYRLWTGVSLAECDRRVNAEKANVAEAYEAEIKKLTETGEKPERIVLFEQPIDGLELTVRAFNCLRRSGVKTVGDLAKLTKTGLLRMRSLGVKTANQIIVVLARHGITIEGEQEMVDELKEVVK